MAALAHSDLGYADSVDTDLTLPIPGRPLAPGDVPLRVDQHVLLAPAGGAAAG